ncbi:MAG: ABC transporter permease [Undibacterium sp.]|nr:ABC transporter permease [Undibacterium sp.]
MISLFALIRKDLILFLSDRRALLITLFMPIVLAAFFGYVMGGSGTKETTKIDIAVVMQDSHLISQKILAGLKAEPTLSVTEMSLEKAQDLVRKGKLGVAVQLPFGFGEAAGAALFGAKSKPDLPVFYDPSQSAVLAMVKGMLTQQVMQSVSGEMFSGKTGNQTADKSLAELTSDPSKATEQKELVDFLGSLKKYQEHQKKSAENALSDGATQQGKTGLAMPFNTKEEAMTAIDSVASKYNGYAHSFAGMTVQFILFMAIDAGIGVLLARKHGLWGRLLAAPLGVNTLVLARGLSCSIIAFGLTCFIFAFAMLVFKVQILGSFIGFVGVAISFSLMTASFGLLIAAFGKTPEAARGIAVFATLVMVMLGGAWMPSFLFPQWLQDLTLFIPTRWAVDGFDAMTWRGLGLDAALPSIGVLLLFSLGFGLLASWQFRRQQTAN